MQAANGLDSFSRRLPAAIDKGLLRAAELTRAHMKTNYLSGSPLRVQTGRLRSGWSVTRVTTSQGRGVALATQVKYAAVHNFGFSGPVQVKEHTRRPKRKRRSRARGGQVKQLRDRAERRAAKEHRQRRESLARASHGVSLRTLQAQTRAARRSLGLQDDVAERFEGEAPKGRIRVRAHGRFMKIRGHRYVERSLRDTAPRVRAVIARHVLRAIRRGVTP